ncbi:hypothetical protein ACFODZ_08530 [Marinicella sediminis]|uniref:Uncharacterized protein n=1 Tax=Marinicella sediminis TaxID=1792834 RepID=A0ABV7JAS5_9GAMM|nr:hypothetical protein [Marinicella sediminis]
MIKDLIVISILISGGYFGYQKFKAIQAEEAVAEANQPAVQGYSREQQIQQHIDAFENMKVKTQDASSVYDQLEQKNQKPDRFADQDPVFCKKAEREMENLNTTLDFNDKRAVNRYYDKKQKIQQRINKYCGCAIPGC